MRIVCFTGRRMGVLDNYGYMSLEQNFNEMVAVEAARICTGLGDDLLTGGEKDKRLLQKLLELNHNTPLEHIVMRWKVRCPLFVARQWLRHRMGVFNELSLRYTVAQRKYYVPNWNENIDEYIDCYQAGTNYLIEDSDGDCTLPGVTHDHCHYIRQVEADFGVYDHMLATHNWKKEQLRGLLPVSIYTEFIWTVNAWSFMNWMNRRLDKHAQAEHRAYAIAGLGMFMMAFPWLGEAYIENKNLRESGDPDILNLIQLVEERI